MSEFGISNKILETYMNNSLKVISHRGRSDIFPENTLQSLSEALLTSDYAEFDVCLTKDHQVIVFHDRFFGQTTNIASFPEFKERKQFRNDNLFGQPLTEEWWVKDFTLSELQRLSVIQKYKARPQIKDKQFKIPTLDELLKHAVQVKKHCATGSGLLLEIKTEREDYNITPRDEILLQKINECLKQNNLETKEKAQASNLPIIVQTFNKKALRQWYQNHNQALPIIHLYYNEDLDMSEESLAKQKTPQSIGVGISTTNLTRQFVQICSRMNYIVFYWSVVDDMPEIPFDCNTYEEFYKLLKNFKVHGIITDFAANCFQAINQKQ